MAKAVIKTFTVDRAKWLHGGLWFTSKAHHRAEIARAKAEGREPDFRDVSVGPDTLLFDSGVNKMCCLGFVCRQVGIPAKSIAHVGMPDGISELEPAAWRRLEAVGLVKSLDLTDPYADRLDTKFATAAANLNDDANLTLATRERKLIALFKKHNLGLVFTGKHPQIPIITKS